MPVDGEYHDNIESAMAAGLAEAGSRAAQKSLFDRADWLSKLKSLALPRKEALIVAAKSPEGECWLPLMRTGKHRAEALANYYNFTFRPIFHNVKKTEIGTVLLTKVARVAARHCARIDLAPLPSETNDLIHLAICFQRAGWLVFTEQCDENHILPVNGRSFEDYWQSRPGRLRSTVKRKAKKSIVDIRIDTEFSEDAWAAYEEVYAQSWKPEEGSPEFLKAIAKAESEAGALRLGTAYIDGKPVAAQFWTCENGEALIHKLAHVEDDAKASPGTLLSHALFRHVIDIDKVSLVDFGTGNDAYKTDWMEEVRPRYRLIAMKPFHPANWPKIVRSVMGSMGKRLAAKPAAH